MANMSKSDLLNALADGSGCSKADVEKVIDTFFAQVTAAAKSDDAISWPGFGKFSRSERSARMGRNPQTGAEVQIAASCGVKFSAAKALKEDMNS
jgi:DNA-binding protein HU-beta